MKPAHDLALCPNDDTLGALVHHALAPDDRARVTAHLDECATCQQLVVAAVRGGAAMAPTEDDAPRSVSEGGPRAPIGQRIGRYELRALLGVGAMGAVYDAHDAELDRSVALKVLRPELGAAPLLTARLLRESRLMAKATHPSVITVFDVGRIGDVVFIAMELIRGTTLTDWLATHTLDWRATVALFERAGEGLHAAHGAGIVHRDFKPDNVLVARDARKVVVTDFGIAREAALPGASDEGDAVPSCELRMTREGFVAGTPAYMAPEQISGSEVDHRADIFAFSVALWEAVFHCRPFAGRSVAEILAAMRTERLRPPVGAPLVPRRLMRALRRGLALDPRDRWPDMPALLAELAAIRSFRTRVSVAASAVGFVGVGIAAALAVTHPAAPVDRCARALAGLDEAYAPPLERAVEVALAHQPALLDDVRGRLRATAAAWRSTHLATCRAERDVAQDAKTTACLDARRIELAAAVDDLILDGADGAGHARRISAVPGDPAACAAPAPGLLFARVPADRTLRRQVSVLRAQLADADAARDRGDLRAALTIVERVADAARAWPPLDAEARFALGVLHDASGNARLAIATLRDTAAIAERVHRDDIAADCWIQLARALTAHEGDPARALEYTTYAEAAADRIGRPPAVILALEITRGDALVAANRSVDAELALSKAIALAEAAHSDQLASALSGLGALYEGQGRYADAVATYRRAIAHLPRSAAGQVVGPPQYFLRLAKNLARLGETTVAESEARGAVEIADRTLSETQLDRPYAHVALADILNTAGRSHEALAEVTAALAAFAKVQGTRSERYGEVLGLKGDILIALGRAGDAEPQLARACDIVAFASGEDSAQFASCEIRHARALAGLHRPGAVRAKLDIAIPRLVRARGASHPEVADALVTRGTANAVLRHHAAAIADFERASAILEHQEIEPGYLAAARWRLARELWQDQPARARAEIKAAMQLFERASGSWAKERTEAVTWLTSQNYRLATMIPVSRAAT